MPERLFWNCWLLLLAEQLSPVLQSVARLELFTLRGLMSLFLLLTFGPTALLVLLFSLRGVEVTRPVVDWEVRRELGGSWDSSATAAWKLER